MNSIKQIHHTLQNAVCVTVNVYMCKDKFSNIVILNYHAFTDETFT